MSLCDDVRTRVFLRASLDAEARAHLVTCVGCAADAAALRRAAEVLGAAPSPIPPDGLGTRVRAAAAPVLARAARRQTWRAVAAAIAIALVPLPVILFLDVTLVRTAYDMLSAVLPRVVTLYLVSSYAAVLVILLALTYASIPLLAERQLRASRVAHG